MGRILCLDYGLRRTGVAISDPTGTIAQPLCTIQMRKQQQEPDAIGRVRFRTQTQAAVSGAELSWDATGAGSGVYLYTVENGRSTAAGRLPVVK